MDDFYQKTNFRKFYDDHRKLYEMAETEANELFKDFKASWFSDFFGVEFKYPTIYIALGNGPSNYYIVYYESEADYAIVIGGEERYFPEYTIPIILHAICHNYSNPLFYQYWSQMEFGANTMYENVKEDMSKNAYGSASDTAREWQNNLFTAMYLRDNEPLYESFWVGGLRDRGFIWLPRSVQFMENFYNNRDKYPHIDSFMPQLVRFLNYTADDFEQVKFEFQHRRPYIVGVFPVNGSNITDGNFSEIEVTFSQPMAADCYRVGPIKDDPSITKLPRSETIDAYWKDAYTFVIPIEPTQIEKNKKYGLVLGCRAFMTNDYNKMGSDYRLTYNTCSK